MCTYIIFFFGACIDYRLNGVRLVLIEWITNINVYKDKILYVYMYKIIWMYKKNEKWYNLSKPKFASIAKYTQQ